MLVCGGKKESRQSLLVQAAPWDLCFQICMEWGDKLFDDGIVQLHVCSTV